MEADNETILQCVMNAYVSYLRERGMHFGSADHAAMIEEFNQNSHVLKLRMRDATVSDRMLYYAKVNILGQFYRSPYHPFTIRERMQELLSREDMRGGVIPASMETLFKDIRQLPECHVLSARDALAFYVTQN